MLPVGFEPTISAGERPQTYALDRTATGTGKMTWVRGIIIIIIIIIIIFDIFTTYFINLKHILCY